MGVLGLLTVEELQERSRSNVVKETEIGIVEFYIDLAESLLNTQSLNANKTGYAINVGYAVLKLVEHLLIQDQENFLMALAGPFSQERMGSYSYRIKDIEQQGWPPIVEKILKMYRGIPESYELVITSRVFEELRHSETTGFRTPHDLLTRRFDEYEMDKTKP